MSAKPKAGEPGIRRYKRYPAYKDSGVEWLGEVPSHWQVHRLKTVASVRLSNVDKKSLEGEEEVRLCNYVDVYYNDRIAADLEFMAATATREQINRFSLRKDDVLITKDSESWTDIAVPSVVDVDMPDVLCGYHLALIRPDKGHSGRFLARAFSAVGPRDQFQFSANGITRFGLTGEAIRSAVFALPPTAAEQEAIASFLDRETARIDALVAKKEKLIQLLREKRATLITRLVTKGLDPGTTASESGIEWLGQIPAHWSVDRIKWVARMESGHTPDKKIESYWQGGDIPWVSLADTQQLRETDYIDDTRVRTTADGLANSSAHVLPAGTVVFSRDATIGLCAITKVGMAVSQHFIGWVCGNRVVPEYLLFVLRSMTAELERLTMGATVRTIGMPDVRSLVMPVPPVSEQEAIVARILNARARIDELVSKTHDAIRTLHELRAALLSAAVTGKIDVRKEVA